MEGIENEQSGGHEVMRGREVLSTVLGTGEVLVQVAASGVNFIDLYVPEGRYADPVPFTPGQEAAGTIVALGANVSHLKEGDRVAWCSVLGSYPEYPLPPATRVVPLPPVISSPQSAA